MGWTNRSAYALVLGVLSVCEVMCKGQSVCRGPREVRRCDAAAAALLGSCVVPGWELDMEHGLYRAWSILPRSSPTQRPAVFLQRWATFLLSFLPFFKVEG